MPLQKLPQTNWMHVETNSCPNMYRKRSEWQMNVGYRGFEGVVKGGGVAHPPLPCQASRPQGGEIDSLIPLARL
ncbi:hypothetical protein RRU01S_19_00090 [Agrobacterium rubi TR3 = NBRC 13261]|uniref:Uncharacterized protein n=1 Tax=Agrobacterium rubi TR3 = NBRC 13261 TaxID=1368415 RepID=A0A081CY59_9HYPH|nr:hypothetical protein RRU01S_19_00090 [Agrobacterium rubi TR3 = NBRC 13261]